MPRLESALITLNSATRPAYTVVNAVAMLLVTAAYLVVVLTVPLSMPQRLVWLAAYPVVQSEMSGIGFGRVFLLSLWVLPLAVAIGIFNPLIETRTALTVCGVEVNEGWVSLLSIILRGLLSMQAAIIMTRSAGFYGICGALRRLGTPKVLVVQILFTYRYMEVVVSEALGMDRARKARGFGRGSYPLTMWGRMVGQLLVRSYERAGRIHRAMLARGFDGTLPTGRETETGKPNNLRSWIFVIIWIGIFAAIRFCQF